MAAHYIPSHAYAVSVTTYARGYQLAWYTVASNYLFSEKPDHKPFQVPSNLRVALPKFFFRVAATVSATRTMTHLGLHTLSRVSHVSRETHLV